MRTIISIISDHLQPNFLLIKELERSGDKLVFVITEKMEAKADMLENALNREKDSIDRVRVFEDDFINITDRLSEKILDPDGEYLVNLTGGTKPMAITVYSFFKKLKSQFYYIPIGKNRYRNMETNEEKDITRSINLREYFALYGLRFECNKGLTKKIKHAKSTYERFRSVDFDRDRIDLFNVEKYDTPEDKRYYGGGWFEEYCYDRLKQENQLKDDCICLSAKIFRKDSERADNELDIVFIKDNALYVFECKVTLNGLPRTKTGPMYKLAAITKDLGIDVHSYILTLHNIQNFNDSAVSEMKKRSEILKLNVLDCKEFLKDKLNIF